MPKLYFSISDDVSRKLQSMNVAPSTADELIETLQQTLFDFMRQRKDKRPGKFKERVNKTGSSIFVQPRDLIVTLLRHLRYT